MYSTLTIIEVTEYRVWCRSESSCEVLIASIARNQRSFQWLRIFHWISPRLLFRLRATRAEKRQLGLWEIVYKSFLLLAQTACYLKLLESWKLQAVLQLAEKFWELQESIACSVHSAETSDKYLIKLDCWTICQDSWKVSQMQKPLIHKQNYHNFCTSIDDAKAVNGSPIQS